MIPGAQCSGCCFCLRAEPNQPNVRLHAQLSVSICLSPAGSRVSYLFHRYCQRLLYCRNTACLELLQWSSGSNSESLETLQCNRWDFSPYQRVGSRTSLGGDTGRTWASDSRRNVVLARNINLPGPS